MKTSVYVAASLDGFIARPDGNVDWLPAGDENTSEDYGFQSFLDSVDALVMGRNTFELVLTFGAWPYGAKPVIVLTSHKLKIPENFAGNVLPLSGSPAEIIKNLIERGYEHLYIDGGKTIQGFLNSGLIDELIISRIPVLIGSGIPLFGNIQNDIRLVHIHTSTFLNGIVQSKYQIAKG